jgi:hypothetical protein
MNSPIDMAQFVAPKSDQLNADDLMGGPMTIRVTKVTANGEGAADQPISVHYEGGDGRPFKPCKSMRRLMMHCWGRYADQYVGRSMTLFRDDAVTFGADKTGGIRVSHMSHIEGRQTVALTATRGKRKPYTVQPLEVGADANRAKADAWVADHIQAINAAGDMATLDKVLSNGEKARAKLSAQYADLADKVNVAISQARDALATDDPFDAQTGELITLETAKGEIDAAIDIEAVNAIVAATADLLSEADGDALRSYAMERVAALGGEA